MSRFLRIAGIALALAAGSSAADGAGWKGIEPLQSRRADVIRVLGKPIDENAAGTSMRFATREGEATVFLVTREFAGEKRWDPAVEGTVVQIILQHENSKKTPKALGLEGNNRFERQVRGDSVFYRNRKDGIIHIFKDGKLATTIYAPADGGPGAND